MSWLLVTVSFICYIFLPDKLLCLYVMTIFSSTLVGADEQADLTDVPVGKCDMHKGNLMGGLALTLVERKEGNKVVNKWHPFHQVYKKTKGMGKWVCGANRARTTLRSTRQCWQRRERL